MNATRPTVAAFDVDGTLTIRDCVRPFLEMVGGRRRMAASTLRRPLASVGALVKRDRDEFKEIIVGGVMRGRLVREVEASGDRFADMVHDRWLRSDVLQRLRWHQGAGHRTLLVSASLGNYLRPLARRLRVDDVLCTETVQVGDRYGDRLLGRNCRADEKQRRLDQWLADHGLLDAEVWAYGDSEGDRELLARADHGFLVKGIAVSPAPLELSA
jgi:phosphatidylglycerophosphatase C